MFQGARFQGDLSHWTLSNLSTDNRYRMFPARFEGILPRIGTTYQDRRELYRSVHGGSKGLTAYLEGHPFNAMHLDIALNSKRRPHGIESTDWAWAQKIGVPVWRWVSTMPRWGRTRWSNTDSGEVHPRSL